MTLQRKASVLIGMEQFRSDMINAITALKTSEGAYVQQYLRAVVCSDTIKGHCTVAEYLSSVSVRWHGKELDNSDKFHRFGTVRANLIDTLVEHIEQYFPEGSLENFEILNPKSWNLEPPGNLFHYGAADIKELAGKLCPQLNADSIGIQWRNIITEIARNENQEFCKFRNGRPTTFWKHFLTKGKTWPNEITQLLKTVLVLPIGSSDAERGFSTMKYLKRNRRLLKSTHLDHLMRIRINGPNDISRFQAVKYARKWIAEGHFRTDNPAGGGRKRTRVSTGRSEPDEAMDTVDISDEEGEDDEGQPDEDVQFLTESTLF